MASSKETIASYEQQLKIVLAAIDVALSETERADLTELKNNLEEVISLTKQSLQTSNINNENNSSTLADSPEDDEYERFKREMEDLGGLGESGNKAECDVSERITKHDSCDLKEESDIIGEISKLEGSKVKVPYTYPWGEVSSANALVHSIEPGDYNDVTDIKLIVMFLQPCNDSMKPCNFFLDGHCRFSSDKCRFNHGYKVPFTSISDYTDPDFSTIVKGSRVLVKTDQGVWTPGLIEDILGNELNVKLTLKKEFTAVNIDEVIPLETGVPVGTSSESEDESYEEYEDEDCEPQIVLPAWEVDVSNGSLGVWEKHTRGIGSQLMEKMGYTRGQGLGKNGEGRVEPVEATLFPQGKSLDQCMHLRETGKLLALKKRQERKDKQLEESSQRAYQRSKKGNVFDFLNTRILSKESSQKAGPSGFSKSNNHQLKQDSDRLLCVKSFETSEALTKARRDMDKLKSSLGRHHATTSAVGKHIKSKIEQQHSLIQQLSAQVSRIQREQDSRKSNKKLAIF